MTLVYAIPLSKTSRAWLEREIDRLAGCFQELHSDARHTLSLTRRPGGMAVWWDPDAYPRIEEYIGDEEHARRVAQEIHQAIARCDGNPDEFDIGTYNPEIVS